MRLRVIAVAIVGIAALAAIGGVLFAAVRGGTTTSRAVAYALWFAAAGLFVFTLPLRMRRSRYSEGWIFVAGAFALTALGALIDALG